MANLPRDQNRKRTIPRQVVVQQRQYYLHQARVLPVKIAEQDTATPIPKTRERQHGQKTIDPLRLLGYLLQHHPTPRGINGVRLEWH